MSSEKQLTIRDFIYVDVDRLYSLYSQVFEGVAEQIIQSYMDSSASLDQQKGGGGIISGSTTEAQVAEMSSTTERKVLYDHIYNRLESKLKKSILEVSEIPADDYIETLSKAFIIKVRGTAEIEDYNRVKIYMEKLNSLGEAVAYSAIQSEEFKNKISEFEEKANVATAAEKSKLKEYIKKIRDPKLLSKEMGLHQDEKLLENLKKFVEIFYPEGFEITIKPDQRSENVVFRGIVDKKWLRVKPELLRALYGGLVKMQWTMVCQITFLPLKGFKLEEPEVSVNTPNTVEKDPSPLRDPFRAIFQGMRIFDSLFLESQQRTEILVCPLAIYREVSLPTE
jgi:hypothetical protein